LGCPSSPLQVLAILLQLLYSVKITPRRYPERWEGQKLVFRRGAAWSRDDILLSPSQLKLQTCLATVLYEPPHPRDASLRLEPTGVAPIGSERPKSRLSTEL